MSNKKKQSSKAGVKSSGSKYNKNTKKTRKIRQRELLIKFSLAVIAAAAIAVILRFTVFSDNTSVGEIILSENSVTSMSDDADTSQSTVLHSVDIEVQRMLLTLNEYSRPGTKLQEITGVVVHYTANPGTSAEQNRNYFENLKTGEDETYASSHFIIGTDGEIVQCVPLDEVAYCSNDRNYDTISIECCHNDETGEFTDATYQSLVRLTTWLCEEYSLASDSVIRHYDVTGKECPKYFVDHEDAWEAFRSEIASMLSAGEVS